ncbi:WAS/WASL-interacting protein family member 3-like [Penaeus japonicus]|uniref:WAS/WASL-interacting protein family member 3-like n=1 Tax=Penaeus japonicus TaxID=27405 RepID=UPI001C711295|nr:WAS/WASL-interacting protein family member 3-like [Penaeus japonicus]
MSKDTHMYYIAGTLATSVLLFAFALFYYCYRRRPDCRRGTTWAALRSCFVLTALDSEEELRLSQLVSEIRASASQPYQGSGNERPPPPWPHQGPDPMLEYLRPVQIVRPTRTPPPPPSPTTRPRRGARRRRRKAHRRSAHPDARRKSLVGACAEAPPSASGAEGIALEKGSRADPSESREDRRQNDYALRRGSKRPETRVIRRGSGRRKSLRRGSLLLAESARLGAAGGTPKPSEGNPSTEGLPRPEDYEDALPGPSDSPTPFARWMEIQTPLPPPSLPLLRCPCVGPSAPAPPPAISPKDMVCLLEKQAVASFPVPWVVVSAVGTSERRVWPPFTPRQRLRGRLHPGLYLPGALDPLAVAATGEQHSTPPGIRRRSRSKGKEGRDRPFTPPTPDFIHGNG